jgi:acetylornithine deacetylase/succinyl-diaminopimelate desuccinylase-like protein
MTVKRALWPLLLLSVLEIGCHRKANAAGGLEADLTRPPAVWLTLEPVRLLRDYVRIDTTDGKGELQGAQYLRNLFACAGIESELVCPAPRRCNLLARLPGRTREGALLLLNHIDVADAYPVLWSEAKPFEGKIELGFLYGRGAYDMKSLALAEALAMRNLKAHGIVPQADILFLAEADEEAGQKWGSRWLLEHRPEWFSGVRQVLNEGGTNEMILRDVRFWGIETVQAGCALIELEAPRPQPLEDLANKWRKVESPVVEPHPDVVIGFDMLANHQGDPLTDPLRHLNRVRRNPAELALLPDRYGGFLQARIMWSAPYAYPPGATDNFRAYVMVSTPPGMSPDTYSPAIRRDAAREGARIVETVSSGVTSGSPYLTASGELFPLVALLKRVTEARHPGVPFGPFPTIGGTTTSVYFRQRGIPTYGYSPIAMNFTDSIRRHGNDERIFLRDYLNGVDLYRDVLEEFALTP